MLTCDVDVMLTYDVLYRCDAAVHAQHDGCRGTEQNQTVHDQSQDEDAAYTAGTGAGLLKGLRGRLRVEGGIEGVEGVTEGLRGSLKG